MRAHITESCALALGFIFDEVLCLTEASCEEYADMALAELRHVDGLLNRLGVRHSSLPPDVPPEPHASEEPQP